MHSTAAKWCHEAHLQGEQDVTLQFIHFLQFGAPHKHGILCWSSSKSNL